MLKKPFKRTVRQLSDGSYAGSGNGKYIEHFQYSESPSNHLRAFDILIKDFIDLLNYIEPSDINLKTYSFKIHELLLRTCIEIESNFFAVLSENGYSKRGNWKINDFYKVESTHHLSSYEVRIPLWKGEKDIRKPFLGWKSNPNLSWFKAYNKIKHERHINFTQANFENLTDAICGLAALIASQFRTYKANAENTFLMLQGGPNDGMDDLIGDFFRVKYPRDWKDEEKYDFKWSVLKDEPSPICSHNYNLPSSKEY